MAVWGFLKTAARWVAPPVLIVGFAYTALLISVYNARDERIIASSALGEDRSVTIYYSVDGQETRPRPMIYGLDGERFSHGLLPAAHGQLAAYLSGNPQGYFIAIHEQGGRDVDLRPQAVQPASWRPNISGRGPDFDRFLVTELRKEIERDMPTPSSRILFGHSLAGFYAIDMAARNPDHGFDSIYAFSPTFSHDLSILKRLENACSHTAKIYANIGLESGRDTAVFDEATSKFASSAQCEGKVKLASHWGVIHQLIMLTGQIEAFAEINRDRKSQ